MPAESKHNARETTRVLLDTPTFSPPREMRADYLNRRKAELENLLFQARENNWKQVVGTVNHVRGSGGMYGFPAISAAAESVVLAVQGGNPKSLDVLLAYAEAVGGTSV